MKQLKLIPSYQAATSQKIINSARNTHSTVKDVRRQLQSSKIDINSVKTEYFNIQTVVQCIICKNYIDLNRVDEHSKYCKLQIQQKESSSYYRTTTEEDQQPEDRSTSIEKSLYACDTEFQKIILSLKNDLKLKQKLSNSIQAETKYSDFFTQTENTLNVLHKIQHTKGLQVLYDQQHELHNIREQTTSQSLYLRLDKCIQQISSKIEILLSKRENGSGSKKQDGANESSNVNFHLSAQSPLLGHVLDTRRERRNHKRSSDPKASCYQMDQKKQPQNNTSHIYLSDQAFIKNDKLAVYSLQSTPLNTQRIPSQIQFFKICNSTKFKLPQNHPVQKVSALELYTQAMNQQIPLSELDLFVKNYRCN